MYKMTRGDIFISLGIMLIPFMVLTTAAVILRSYGYNTDSFICGGLLVFAIRLLTDFCMVRKKIKNDNIAAAKMNNLLKGILKDFEALETQSSHHSSEESTSFKGRLH